MKNERNSKLIKESEFKLGSWFNTEYEQFRDFWAFSRKKNSKINKVNGILKIWLLGKEKNNLFKSKVSLKNKSESSKDSENNSSNAPKGKKN